MSGHNRWAKVKHVKAKTDAIKGRTFTKLIKELVLAARNGGGDPNTNAKLRVIIGKTKEANMPSDTVKKAIMRGTGELEGVNYEEITYEGYGPGGVAVLVEVLTDNKNKAAAEVRHLFERNGGKMGEAGSVAWMFDRKTQILIAKSAVTEEKLMEIVLDAGADDIQTSEDGYEVTGDWQKFEQVKEALDKAGIATESAEVAMVPKDTVRLEGGDAQKMLKMMEKFEEYEDTQNVYANHDVDDSVMEAMEA